MVTDSFSSHLNLYFQGNSFDKKKKKKTKILIIILIINIIIVN